MSDQASIDYMILADHAEVASGKLYMNGGGWTDLFRPAMPDALYLNNFSVAISLSIPWGVADRLHTLAIHLEKQEDSSVLSQAHSVINIGKPATVPERTIQHVLVVGAFNIVFPRAGNYLIVAILDEGGDRKEYVFRVHDVAMGT